MSVKAAVKLYESFRERKPRRIGRADFKVPAAVACMGYVEGIDYRTTHGKKVTLYHHDFAPGSRPLLAVSSDGKQLLLLGGRYQFTERGIVDRDAKGREVENAGHGKTINPRRSALLRTRKAAEAYADEHGFARSEIKKSRVFKNTYVIARVASKWPVKGKTPRKRNPPESAELAYIVEKHGKFYLAGRGFKTASNEQATRYTRADAMKLATAERANKVWRVET